MLHCISSRVGSVVVAHVLSRPMACGIFPDQGSNLGPLHWQMDSWDHQGSPQKQYSFCHCLFGFLDSSVFKESACIAGDPNLIPGSGRSSGEGIGYPLQYSWASLVAQLVKKICLQCWRPGFNPWIGKIPWRRERLPTLVFWPGEFHGVSSSWGRKDMTE